MKKKLFKAFNIFGDIGFVGFSTTFIYFGMKALKWSFSEFENDIKC